MKGKPEVLDEFHDSLQEQYAAALPKSPFGQVCETLPAKRWYLAPKASTG